MDLSQALTVANQAMLAQYDRGLSDVETAIFEGSWENQTYDKIAEISGYSDSYLRRDVAPKLWKLLSKSLGESVSKKNFKAALGRKWQEEQEVIKLENKSEGSHPSTKNNTKATRAEQQELCQRYSCNALALKIVATSIQDLFDGAIAEFLAEDTILFYNVRRLLEEQFNRLDSLGQSIMYWLAINREWTTIAELAADITPKVRKLDLLGALESLMWRSLVEKQEGKYTQQPVVMEYVSDRLLESVTQELTQENIPLNLFHNYALIKTTVKDYLKDKDSGY